MSEKAKLEYHVDYYDDDDNLLSEEENDRGDFDLQCTSCHEIVVSADDRYSAESFMEHWNYCPICGVKFEKEEK